MAALKLDLTEDLRSRLQVRAEESGFASIEEYVQMMLVADAAGPGVNDEELEAMLVGRLNGPFVEVTADDFGRMREKIY